MRLKAKALGKFERPYHLTQMTDGLSYKIFLLLSVLFLLQVASISKSSGTKFPAEELPRIQEALYQAAINQVKTKKNPN